MISIARAKILVVYLIFIPIFGLAAVDKFLHGMPEWFVKQFSGTVLDFCSNSIAASFYFIAVLELSTAILFFISLLK